MILQFKGIEYKFLIGNGEIYNLKIENQHFLADILSWLQEMDEEKIMLFDTIFLDLQKYLLFLSDVINLDLNIKKQLTTLYTNIDKNIIKDEQRIKLSVITEYISDLMKDITIDNNVELDYDASIDFKTLFSAINLRYKTEDQYYFHKLIYYLKATIDISKYKVFICYSLLDLLTDFEIDLLKELLEYNHLSLISIGNSSVRNGVKTIIVDSDLCLI